MTYHICQSIGTDGKPYSFISRLVNGKICCVTEFHGKRTWWPLDTSRYVYTIGPEISILAAMEWNREQGHATDLRRYSLSI
jgi:hypothetical protein